MARVNYLGNVNGSTSGTATATSISIGLNWGQDYRTAAGGMYLLAGVAIGNSLTTSTTATMSYAGNNFVSLGKITCGSGTTAGFIQMFGLDMGVKGSAIPLSGTIVVSVNTASTIVCNVAALTNCYGGAIGSGTVNSSAAGTSASFNVNADSNSIIFDMMASRYAVNSVSGGHLQSFGLANNNSTNAGCFSFCNGNGTGTAQTWNWGFSQSTNWGYALTSVKGTDVDLSRTETGTFTESASVVVVNSPAQPSIRTRWDLRPSGQTLSNSSTGDEGGTFVISPTGSGVSATTTGTSLAVTWPDSTGNALYIQERVRDSDQRVEKIAADFGFGPSTSNTQALALASWDTDYPTGGTTNAQIHFSTTPVGWYYAVVQNGVVQTPYLASGSYTTPMPMDYTRLHAAVNLIGNTAYIDLPDGTVTTVTDSRIGSIKGYQACWEFYRTSDSTTAPMVLYETHAGAQGVAKPLSTNKEPATLTDSSSLYTFNYISTSDLATESEQPTLVAPRTTDSATTSDSSSIYPTTYIATSDLASETDSSALSAFVPTSDIATQTEQTSSYSSTTQTSDLFAGSDTSTRSATLATSDSATVTDSSVVFKGDAVLSSSETYGLTDTSANSTSRSTSDLAVTTDSSSSARTTQTTDTSTTSDTSAYTATLSTTDAATITDASNVSTATPIVGMETPSVVDASQVTAQVTTSDLAGLTESSSVAIMVITTDSATATDASRPINVNTSDLATTTELNRTVAQFRSDAATFSEVSRINISTTDSAATTEQRSSGPKTSDLFSLLDKSQPGNSYTYTADLFTLGEQTYINATDINSSDLFTWYEQANYYDEPIQRDDPFIYPDDTIHNKNFRVIAQDHFTRKFLSWDLPVDNVKITYTLSGPALFQGVLSTEMESVKDLGLEPDRTWLYVEEDGEIQGAFMMTPFVDNPQSETRLIEGEGFSSYPYWITYEGDPFVGIQVDPAEIIRKLWAHVQSFPDGNLGVRVSELNTPIRIGEPPQSVNFFTKEGNLVSFQKGPYNLNFWSSINCGQEIEKLCKESPIEFYEVSMWNANKTDVDLYLILGYPRVGTRRGDLGFREGENLFQLIPSYQETQENYASDVLVIGAGNGPTAIRAKHSQRIGRIRKTNVITNQDITTVARAQSIADFEFNRISKSRFLIQNVTVDLTHDNSVWGSFQCGDDIFVEATVDYVGLVQAWYRITSYIYDPYFKTATLSLSPSDSFTYGSENVDPYNNLPTVGFAKLAKTQDFSKLTAADQETISQSDLRNAIAQQAQQLACDYFNKTGIANDECIYYYYIQDDPPLANCYKGPLSILADTTKILCIARDSAGHIITGDNILLIANDGTVGQPANETSDKTYLNPYYVAQQKPTSASTGTSNGAGNTSQDNPSAQGITLARAYGMDHKNELQNGRGFYYRVLPDNSVAVVNAPYPSGDSGLILIVYRNSNGGLMYGDNVASANASSPQALKDAAREILNASNAGKRIYEDFSFAGCSANVSKWNDTLTTMYQQAGSKYGFTGFLQAVISGQLVP